MSVPLATVPGSFQATGKEGLITAGSDLLAVRELPSLLGTTQSAPDPSLPGKAGTPLSEGETGACSSGCCCRHSWGLGPPCCCPSGALPPVAPVPSLGRACGLLKLRLPLVSLFVAPGLPRTALPRRGWLRLKSGVGQDGAGRDSRCVWPSRPRTALLALGAGPGLPRDWDRSPRLSSVANESLRHRVDPGWLV